MARFEGRREAIWGRSGRRPPERRRTLTFPNNLQHAACAPGQLRRRKLRRRCAMMAACVSCSPWCHARRPSMNWKPNGATPPVARPCALSTWSAADVRSAVVSRSHCATAPSTLTTRRPALLVSRDSAALMSATPRRVNVSMSVTRSAPLRVHLSSLAISTAPTWRP